MAYLGTEKEWAELARYLTEDYAGPLGLDSEFEGVNFAEGDSCVNKADITVWSIACLSDILEPRGFFRAKGAVLPRAALQYPQLVKLLESSRTKVLHNSNVDVHAFFNAGVDLDGVVNSLSLARWMLPARLTYNLDDLGVDVLGHGKTESFNDLFRLPNIIQVEKTKKVRRCSCQADGCRLRKARYIPELDCFVEHNKYETTEVEVVDKQDGWKFISQYEVIREGPSHPLWDRYIAYAQRDAVLAVELYDYLCRLKTLTEVPWYES